MKYLSVDIETTGLDENNCQILSVAIIIEDTKNILDFQEIPKFHAIILRDFIQGEPIALSMNKDIIESIKDFQMAKTNQQREIVQDRMNAIFIPEEALIGQIKRFLNLNNFEHEGVRITVAGKNFGTFDKKFLERIPRWNQSFKIHQRIIDPATVFMDWENDNELPNLSICKNRAGIEKTEISHIALEDAWDVISVLRTNYKNK